MTILVVDAGIGVKAVLPNDLQPIVLQRLAEWKSEGCELYAPSLWWYETTSAITKAVHFGLINRIEADAALELLQGFNVRTETPDSPAIRSAEEWTYRLKRAAAYDSFYLALAQRLGATLWTADKRLFNAVDIGWVRYIGRDERQ